ncbi:MAG: glycine--tRNA ligase [Nanoarchaeota archaeon]|nr:glycine--tRNA ligase [Nanoarchaeota archaeon]
MVGQIKINKPKADEIINIAGKRGFFFPSGEAYSSTAGFWTYGHLGTLMKHKFENIWRDFFLGLDTNYFEIEDVNILSRGVFQSSGHLAHFNDPLTECSKCHFRFRADELIEDEIGINVDGLKEKELDKMIKDNKLKCPKCGGGLGNVKFFNMMFDLRVGVTGDSVMYLRPETAQSAFVSFKREFMALREKLPMGLAIIGKAFRNEISPRQGFFRLREFTQAELQIFFDPKNIDEAERWEEIRNYKLKLFLVRDRNKGGVLEISCADANKKIGLPKFYVYHLAQVQKFYLELLKIPEVKFRFRELSEKERAFYNQIHFDAEIELDTLGGFKEVSGVHYRGGYDLTQHQKGSKEKFEILYDGKKFIPHVLELSFGVDRHIWALMDLFFKKEKERVFFSFPAGVAPIDVAVFPLVSKDKLPEKATEVYELVRNMDFYVLYDSKGSIGRMYRRVDEIGCPCMITVDHKSLKDNTVTLRDRDSMKQIRIKIAKLDDVLRKYLAGEKLAKLGKII